MPNFHQKLVPVDLSQIPLADFDFNRLPEGIRGIDIGVRPCRQSGPCITAQEKANRLIIHNYGHGGAGWSISHGSVLHTLELLAHHKPDKYSPVTVVGAGVMGLLSVIYLFEQGYRNITLVASQFQGITSCRSTGYYSPLAMSLNSDEQQCFINEIGFKTFNTFQEIEQGQHPVFKCGIHPVNVYSGVGEGPGAIETETGLEPYVNNGILPAPSVGEVDFGNGQRHFMRRFHTYFMNTPEIMQELNQLITNMGICRIQKNINDFAEVQSDIIFNCTGLGARELNQDNAVHPNLGILLLLDQPNIGQLEYIVYTRFKRTRTSQPGYIYFMPRDRGLLGATFIPFDDGSDTQHNRELIQRIIRDNKAFFGT